MNIKAIFFDFDMTLVDSKPIAQASYRALLNYYNKKPTKKGFDEYVGRRVSESINALAEKDEEKKKLIKIFLKVHENKLKKLKVYGKEALAHLRRSKIKIIIISNNAREVIVKTLKAHKLHFDSIIADEDMNNGEKKHQAMKKMMKKLKLKNQEVFYVGDHINDIKEGRKAEMRVISVTTGVFSKKQLEKYRPYRVIKDLNELSNII